MANKPNPVHQAFLDSIRAQPGDDTPRLVFADWLEDNGDPHRAEFIRVQCRLAGMSEDDPDWRTLHQREYDLLAEHRGEWAGPLVGRVRRWEFRRGFVEHLKLDAQQFVKQAKWLMDFAPIQSLDVRHPDLEEVKALLACKHIRRITHLDLDFARGGNDLAWMLANCANLSGLQHLSLEFNDLEPEGLLALAQSPHLQSLQFLDTRHNNLKAEAFAEFVQACQLPLVRLNWRGKVGPEGIRALGDSTLASRLKFLLFREAHMEPKGMRLLAESSALKNLEELTIESDKVDEAGAVALAESSFLPRLTLLELSCVNLNDQATSALALHSRRELPTLVHLDLSFNSIGPAGARALAKSALCAGVRRLDLSGNKMGAGLGTLMRSPHLSQLRTLDLWGCGITPQAAKGLLSSPHLDRLTYLRLSENAIGRKAFTDLRERLGDRLDHDLLDENLDAAEVIARVKANPPRCLRGILARTDTELLRRFPRERLDPSEYASVSFQLMHPDPEQKAVLLGYEDDRGYNIFFSPYAIRWEPSGEQREFFDAEQHGRSGEHNGNCTIIGSGKRTPWKCGKRGCRDHAFLVTFIYDLEHPPRPGGHFADQFYHIDLDAYCGSQDRVFEIASFECK